MIAPPLFAKLLIANRGEIALRILRSAKRLGIPTVVVYSDADAGSLAAEQADEAVWIGSSPARDSYLDIPRILNAARATGATAIHPGYGFLAESADFAAACEGAGVVFVGPSAVAIRAMGSKAEAKALMAEAGVPLVPGYHGAEQNDGCLIAAAVALGFPVLIKPSAGGGGKGMRVVTGPDDIATALAASRREAAASFGDDRLLLERYLSSPRHVEVQIFADTRGDIVSLFERDCSIQRRHQKLVEEAPAPGLSDGLRAALAAAAIKAARAVRYVGAGTVEFILAGEDFYFIEMNTRLQVEHAVTEGITGLDLVEWQLRIAAGQALPLRQGDIRATGHAVEARLYAEDSARDFRPASGRLALLRLPAETADLRIETGYHPGDTVTPYYDGMIAKLIAWGADRDAALRRLAAALAETRLAGLACNRDFLLRLLRHPAMRQPADTGFIERHQADLAPPDTLPDLALASLALLLDGEGGAPALDPHSPWRRRDFWRLDGTASHTFRLLVGEAVEELRIGFAAGRYQIARGANQVTARLVHHIGTEWEVELDGRPVAVTLLRQGADIWIMRDEASLHLRYLDPLEPQAGTAVGGGSLIAPMPAKIAAILVAPGETVRRGQLLLLLEAMKMEHAVTAPADGIVASVHYHVGDLVIEGAELLVLRVAEAPPAA